MKLDFRGNEVLLCGKVFAKVRSNKINFSQYKFELLISACFAENISTLSKIFDILQFVSSLLNGASS